MDTTSTDPGDEQLAYWRCTYATRCMVCGQLVRKGDLIVTPITKALLPFFRKASTKAKWAHPNCAKQVIRDFKDGRTASNRQGYKRRKAQQASRLRVISESS